MSIATTQKEQAAKTATKPTLPSRVRMEQEMMVMRETDQWMCEHYGKQR